MVTQAFNNAYKGCYNFGCASVDATCSLLDRIARVIEKTFNYMVQFALGFCLGSIGTFFYIITQPRPIGFDYSLNTTETAIYAIAGGLIVGAGFVYSELTF